MKTYFTDLWKKHGQFLKDEVRSIFATFVTLFAVDGAGVLLQLWDGDFSRATVFALTTVAWRTLVKAGLTTVFPQLFPTRKSK